MQLELQMKVIKLSQMLNNSNNVVADEMLFTSDNDFFKKMSKKQIKKWADTCMDLFTKI